MKRSLAALALTTAALAGCAIVPAYPVAPAVRVYPAPAYGYSYRYAPFPYRHPAYRAPYGYDYYEHR
jgi:hypothetical protein